MTGQKHLKQLIRARMDKTGERYAAARRFIIGTAEPASTDPTTRWHFAGSVPATTALRVLLAHAGVRAPHTGKPFSEPMLFGIAGGIGIGVFSFYYEKADTATLFIGGRYAWHSDSEYLKNALGTLRIKGVIRETSGARAAAQQLEEAVSNGPCVAWVDMASLPHRAMPQAFRGSSYHVITVYSVDSKEGTARIGDLTDVPVVISLKDLLDARMRIKKQKCRRLSIPSPGRVPDLTDLVKAGLKQCSNGLLRPTIPMSGKKNAQLEAIRTLAERIHGSKDKESWSARFRPGPNLWRGLWGMYTFVEHYGTGGGLCRPMFAEFLNEASMALSDPALARLSERYTALGRAWSDLAEAALPDSVPALRQAREFHVRKAELAHAGERPDELATMWSDQSMMAQNAFLLSDSACDELRRDLRERLMSLYECEVAAHTELRSWLVS